jgi:transcription elongation factor GreA
LAEEPVLLTKEGQAKLRSELAELMEKRPQLAQRLSDAREDAAFGEDATFEETKREHAMLDNRIQELEHILKRAELIGAGGRKAAEEVQPGHTVTVVDDAGKRAKYTIVGSLEADPAAGRISNVSPVGRALVGKRAGDSVEVRVPAGTTKLTIKKID